MSIEENRNCSCNCNCECEKENTVDCDLRREMIQEIRCCEFAITELALYLDTHPNDSNAITLRSDYVNLYKQALNEYEKKYGALNLGSSQLDGYPWKWDVNNWPWEGDK